MTGRGLPVSVLVLTATLAVAGLSTGIAAGTSAPSSSVWVLAPLGAALVTAGWLQVHFHYRGQVEAMDLFEAALVPVVLVVPGIGAVALAVAAKAVSQRLRRVTPVKAAFNTAQWAAVTGTASLVYVRLQGPNHHSTAQTAAVVAGVAAGMLVNHLAVAMVLGIVEHLSVGRTLASLAPVVVPIWLIGGGVNLAFGVMSAALVAAEPAFSPLLLVPLGVLHWAQRAYAETRADRARIEALHRVTLTLAGPVDPADALPDFLGAVRTCFETAAVDLVFLERRVVHHHGDPGTEPLSLEIAARLAGRVVEPRGAQRVEAGDGSIVSDLLRAAGRRNCLIAAVPASGRLAGLLLSYDRAGLEGFEGGEVAVLEALAGELGNALHKSELLSTLVHERAHLSDIIERASDGIFTITSDGVLDAWNPAMHAITGFGADELTGTRGLNVLRPKGPDGEHIPLDQWFDDPGALPDQVEVLTRTGESRWLSCSYARTPPSSDGPESLVVVARDVTRQREVDRMKDDFVATVSHELRTPLTSILGFTQLLLESPHNLDERRQRESLMMIRNGSRRLERLIFNLLEVSMVEAHGTGSSSVPLDLETITADVLAELRETWPDRPIVVRPAAGELVPRGNATSVHQVLHNLVGNALKYATEGPVVVEMTEAPDSVTISVIDEGPGIPEAHHERIFQRFERLDHDHVQAGTGLGLYISRQLALAMGAELSVHSASGCGAVFSLRLPADACVTTLSEPSAR